MKNTIKTFNLCFIRSVPVIGTDLVQQVEQNGPSQAIDNSLYTQVSTSSKLLTPYMLCIILNFLSLKSMLQQCPIIYNRNRKIVRNTITLCLLLFLTISVIKKKYLNVCWFVAQSLNIIEKSKTSFSSVHYIYIKKTSF